ncbi:MAG TPA: hypothetical protein VGF36_16625 [Rhodopila sp.]
MTAFSQHQHFTPLIGKRFDFDGHPVALTLSRIETNPQSGLARTPFTLLFQGPAGDILPEGLYRAHAQGDAIGELYIMPIHTPRRDRQDYQAVFN